MRHSPDHALQTARQKQCVAGAAHLLEGAALIAPQAAFAVQLPALLAVLGDDLPAGVNAAGSQHLMVQQRNQSQSIVTE